MKSPDDAKRAIDNLEAAGLSLMQNSIPFKHDLGAIVATIAVILKDHNEKLETLGSLVLKMHGFEEEK